MNDEITQPGGKPIYVFVYGTLKQGFGNYPYHLKNAETEFVSYGRTKDLFQMYDGGYPTVVNFAEKVAKVAGEVYAITPSVLRSLDRLEGNGFLFIRNLYDIELLDGSVLPCFMYTGVQTNWRHSGTPVTVDEDGMFNWRGYKKAA